jgi:hypothetical protein
VFFRLYIYIYIYIYFYFFLKGIFVLLFLYLQRYDGFFKAIWYLGCTNPFMWAVCVAFVFYGRNYPGCSATRSGRYSCLTTRVLLHDPDKFMMSIGIIIVTLNFSCYGVLPSVCIFGVLFTCATQNRFTLPPFNAILHTCNYEIHIAGVLVRMFGLHAE